MKGLHDPASCPGPSGSSGPGCIQFPAPCPQDVRPPLLAIGETAILLTRAHSPSLLKHLQKVEGGAAEWQSRRRLPLPPPPRPSLHYPAFESRWRAAAGERPACHRGPRRAARGVAGGGDSLPPWRRLPPFIFSCLSRASGCAQLNTRAALFMCNAGRAVAVVDRWLRAGCVLGRLDGRVDC